MRQSVVIQRTPEGAGSLGVAVVYILRRIDPAEPLSFAAG